MNGAYDTQILRNPTYEGDFVMKETVIETQEDKNIRTPGFAAQNEIK